MKYTARMPDANVNVTAVSPLREFLVLLAAVVGIIVGLYFFLGLAVNLIVPRIPPSVEHKMAAPFLRSMAVGKSPTEKDRFIQGLLDTIQDRCARLPYTFTVYVQESPRLNAVSLPGGNIVVFTGLLKKIESENELAFVLAHEMGHYVNRDHLRGIGRALVFMVISATLLGPDSSVGNMLVQSLNMTETAFSRNQETRADEYALNALQCIYGHVGGAAAFFDKLSEEEDTGALGHYLSSHPESRQRSSHLKEYARSKGFFQRNVRAIPDIL